MRATLEQTPKTQKPPKKAFIEICGFKFLPRWRSRLCLGMSGPVQQ